MKPIAVSLLALLAAPISLHAQENESRENDLGTNAIIVTATRTAQTFDETLASVSMITREDIERSQATSLPDMLSGTAGIDLTSNGGYGKHASVYVRGTESDQTLVLIDGIKVGSATLGGTAWQDLPLDQIERIEIVRGPRSSLYGSDAVGGVIQIFTRKPAGGKTTSNAEAGLGSYRTGKFSAGVASDNGKSWIALQMGHLNTEGIDARQPTTGFFGVDQPDKDGYTNDNQSLRLGHRFGPRAELSLHGLRAAGTNEYDGSLDDQSDFVQQVTGAQLKLAPLAFWQLKADRGQSRDESINYTREQAYTPDRFNTLRDTYSLQNDLTISDTQIVTLGGDHQSEHVSSTVDYTETRRITNGVFGQYQGGIGNHSLMLGYRGDDNSQFGWHTTGNLGWGYQIGPLRLVASGGTAFKAPSFNDLYWPGFGNPDILPEESRTGELGLRGHYAWGHWQLTGFRTDIDQMIAYDAASGTVANIDEARIIGIESTIQLGRGPWRSAASYTWLDPRDTETDNLLPRRSQQTVRVDIDRQFRQSGVGVSLLGQDKRYDDKANTIELEGYGLINLHAYYQLARAWTLRVKIDNALDKEYQTSDTYHSLGRNLFVSVAYRE